MARAPMILALANPEPEIAAAGERGTPDARFVPAALTIRNQVNNVLCFPFIFGGWTWATAINEEMKLGGVHAIAELGTPNRGVVASRSAIV